jgi:hypothetical protein
MTGGEGINVVASRRDDRLFANLVNTHSDRSVDVELSPVVDTCRRGGVD